LSSGPTLSICLSEFLLVLQIIFSRRQVCVWGSSCGRIKKNPEQSCQGLFTPVSLRYPLSVFNKNSTLKNELHTLLHCPHSSPLSHPAILSLTCALRRSDLCSWFLHTPLQQTAILLGSSPPKLLRKHDKAWTHSTSTTCTQLIYSLQSHFSNTNPQPLRARTVPHLLPCEPPL